MNKKKRIYLYFCFWCLSEISSSHTLTICPKCKTVFKQERPECMDKSLWYAYDNQPQTDCSKLSDQEAIPMEVEQ